MGLSKTKEDYQLKPYKSKEKEPPRFNETPPRKLPAHVSVQWHLCHECTDTSTSRDNTSTCNGMYTYTHMYPPRTEVNAKAYTRKLPWHRSTWSCAQLASAGAQCLKVTKTARRHISHKHIEFYSITSTPAAALSYILTFVPMPIQVSAMCIFQLIIMIIGSSHFGLNLRVNVTKEFYVRHVISRGRFILYEMRIKLSLTRESLPQNLDRPPIRT